MTKPWDANDPPMALDESHRLLDKSSDWGAGLKEASAAVMLVVAGLLVVWGVGYWLMLIFGFFARN